MTNYKWDFPSGSKKNIGINNGNIETFKDNPIKALGREICQNSLDACFDKNKPVRVKFKSFSISKNEMPDYDGFNDAIERGYTFWKTQNNPKADAFYNKAKKVLASDEILCLRISDFNTIGLGGSDCLDDTQAPWTALVMSEGASSKDGSEGGSFGIGKFAAFANSSLRTVFYSTVDSDFKTASQGISCLATFINANEEKTFGEGFCGDDGKPIYNQLALDKNFSRDSQEVGTDVYILGFFAANDWKQKLIASILDGFMLAIDHDMLVVDVDGEEISKGSLDSIMTRYKDYCDDYATDYYEVLKADTEWIEVPDYKNTGSLRIKLLVGQGLNRRVAMIRKTGMKILDRDHISGQIAFAGIMYIVGEEANKFLVGLENPAHTKWEPERYEENPDKAKRYISDLGRLLKDELKKLIEDQFGGEVAPALGNLLQSISGVSGNNKLQDALVDEPLELKTVVKKELPQQVTVKIEKETDNSSFSGEEGGKDHGEDGSSGSGKGFGSGDDGRGLAGYDNKGGDNGNGEERKQVNKGIKLLSRRPIMKDVPSGLYDFIIKPATSSDNATIEIGISGEDKSYRPDIEMIEIIGQPDIQCEGARIKGVKLVGGEKLKLNMKIKATDLVSFEVKCYETTVE